MTSRERVKKAINHEVPDRVPLDLGSISVTGIHKKSLKFRQIISWQPLIPVAPLTKQKEPRRYNLPAFPPSGG